MAFEVARARRHPRRGRPAGRLPARPGPLGGGRLLGRRPGRPGRHRRPGLRSASGAPRPAPAGSPSSWPPSCGGSASAGRRRERRRGLPPLRGDHHHRGPQLFLRDQAAARPKAAGHVAPCTPWPAASTTSATATRPAPTKLAALAEVRKDVAAVAGDGPYRGDDPVLVALADVARRFPIPLSAFDELIDGCEMDVHGARYHDLRRPGRLLPAGGGQHRAAQPRPCTAPPTRSGPSHSPTPSGWPCRSPTSSATSSRTADQMGRVYLPAEDRERFGVARRSRGPDRRHDWP